MMNFDNHRFTPIDTFFDEIFNQMVSPDVLKVFGATPFKDQSFPKVNIVDYSNRVEIEAELAGYSKSDIDIEVVEDGVLCISGEKSTKSQESDESKILYKELHRRRFKREFNLGDQLDQNNVSAKFDEGLLIVTLPKLSKTEPELRKKVEIK
jgi:HSP20 family protein